jgi:hypothetical protein
MKFFHLLILANLACTSLSFGGREVIDTKDVKGSVADELLFKDQELQLGTFAVYSVGNGPTHAGVFREHSWGDGNEVNYFFMRHIGLGAEYVDSYAHESPDTDNGRFSRHTVNLHHVGGNLFFRWPIESCHLAPYIYVGGGAVFGDRQWGEAHAGGGFEYRFIQHFLPILGERVGIFVDGRWTYLGDRYFPDDDRSRGDLNFFSARAGLRFSY